MDTASDVSHSPSGHPQPQTDRTVTVDTLSLRMIILSLWTPYKLRLIRQCQWTSWTLDLSFTLDSLKPQTDYTFTLDPRLLLRSQSQCALQPPTDQIFTVDAPSLRLIRESQWTPYNLRLIKQSQWTPYTFKLIRYSQWTPHPRTDQAVPVPCNLRLVRESQRTQHNLRLISRPGGHTKTSDWSDIHSRHPTTSDWSDSPTGHPTTSDWSDGPTGHPTNWGWPEIHSWTPQPQTDQTVSMDTPQLQPMQYEQYHLHVWVGLNKTFLIQIKTRLTFKQLD